MYSVPPSVSRSSIPESVTSPTKKWQFPIYNKHLAQICCFTLRVKEVHMTDPVEFIVKKLPYDLSSHGGLALVGRLFKRINLPAVDRSAVPGA